MGATETSRPRAFVYEPVKGRITDELNELGWESNPMGERLDLLLTTQAGLWAVDLGGTASDPLLFLQTLARLQIPVPLLVVADPGHLESDGDALIAFADEWPDSVAMVVRPYTPQELAVRLAWLVHRPHPQEEDGHIHEMGVLRLDVDQYIVTFAGKLASLTPSEFQLLLALMQARGGLVRKEILTGSLPGDEARRSERAMEVHVSRLREKLKALGMNPKALGNVHGVGYRLEEAELQMESDA